MQEQQMAAAAGGSKALALKTHGAGGSNLSAD